MSTTLYEATVARFEQTLTATAGFLAKGREHFESEGVALDDIVESRLHPDMAPFRFQVISTVHHSAGALEGAQSGQFAPPPNSDGVDYTTLEQKVQDALATVKDMTAEKLLSLEDNPLVFALGEQKIPFRVGNFLLSFSIPNFYFHSTTTYDLLRHKGVPVGKRDFLGQLLIGQ